MTATLRSVFDDVQNGVHNTDQMVKVATKVYDKMQMGAFWAEFEHYMKHILIVFPKSTHADRTLDFISKFATSLKMQNLEGDEERTLADEDDDEMHPFLFKLFSFILKHHDACEKAVRYRCCQLLNKLLADMGEESDIGMEMYQSIFDCMLVRLRDKFAIVRVHAVFAMSRLQEPGQEDCPVIEAYLFLLECDPNHDVRRAVLHNIVVSSKTLPIIVNRTNDTREPVRKLAYQKLAENVHIRALTIAQRGQILGDGLKDKSASVRECCLTNLIPGWLNYCEGNIMELLRRLDPEFSEETCKTMLSNGVFKRVPVHELVQNFNLLDEKIVLPPENLTPESALYWCTLCSYLQSLDGGEGEEHIDKVLPSTIVMCEYIQRVFVMIKDEKDMTKRVTNEFIFKQLLLIAINLDLSDEAGRRSCEKLVVSLMLNQFLSHELMAQLLKLYEKIHPRTEQRINQLCEIISEIMQPVLPEVVNESQMRVKDVMIAEIRVEINEKKEELSHCIENQDFEKAAQLKERIRELDHQRENIMSNTGPSQEVITQECKDPITLTKCLTIATTMLESVVKLYPSLISLKNTLIYAGIENDEPAVRLLAVKALAMICVLNKEQAMSNLLVLVKVAQLDRDDVRVVALKGIFDLLFVFGLQTFNVDASPIEPTEIEEESDDSLDSDADLFEDSFEMQMRKERKEKKKIDTTLINSEEAITILLKELTKLLDDVNPELRQTVAEGLAKLMLARRIISVNLLSRLFILWYNPVVEDETYLRHSLGTFFPLYAFGSRENMDLVQESFIPTLNVFVNAPLSSPLSKVNVTHFAQLIIRITNIGLMEKMHQSTHDTTDSTPHDNLAITISNNILSSPRSGHVQLLCKLLDILEITDNCLTTLKDLKSLTHKMLKVVNDVEANKALQKFYSRIKEMLVAAGVTRLQSTCVGPNSTGLDATSLGSTTLGPDTQEKSQVASTDSKKESSQESSGPESSGPDASHCINSEQTTSDNMRLIGDTIDEEKETETLHETEDEASVVAGNSKEKEVQNDEGTSSSNSTRSKLTVHLQQKLPEVKELEKPELLQQHCPLTVEIGDSDVVETPMASRRTNTRTRQSTRRTRSSKK